MDRDPTRGGAAPPGAPTARLAVLVERTRGPQPWRRLFHATSGLLMAGGLVAGPGFRWVVPGLLVLLVSALLLDLVRLASPRANVLFYRAFLPLASPGEARRLASSTWYLVGVLLALVLLPPRAALVGILVLALADPAASWVGRRWGRRPLGKGTVTGSAVFALVAWGGAGVVVGPWVGLGVGVVTAGAEALRVPLDDNLTIPLVAGAVAWVLAGAGPPP